MGDELTDALVRLGVLAQRVSGPDLKAAIREIVEAFRRADDRLRAEHASDPEVRDEWARVSKDLNQGLESLEVGMRHFQEGRQALGVLLIEEGRRE